LLAKALKKFCDGESKQSQSSLALAIARFMFIATATPIGRGAVEVSGRGGLGERVYSLLEGTNGKESLLAPGRGTRRWMNVTTDSGRDSDADKIAARLRFSPDFATKLYDTITPGTTVHEISVTLGARNPQVRAAADDRLT
jgi:hypothetical protein